MSSADAEVSKILDGKSLFDRNDGKVQEQTNADRVDEGEAKIMSVADVSSSISSSSFRLFRHSEEMNSNTIDPQQVFEKSP